jgi:hypothetical protein
LLAEVAVLGMVELLVLEGAALWLWSGGVVVGAVVLAEVSFVTGGVEPEVEAWLPLLFTTALFEELGAEPLGELAAVPVALWSGGVVELGLLVEPAELLPQESEIMLTELTCKLLLSAGVPFTST